MSELNALANSIQRDISRMGERIELHIGQVRAEVGSVAGDVRDTRTDLVKLREDFEQFVQRNERQRMVQLAETRLGTLKSDLERQYGHYGVVRRTSLGILQAFDVGNVRNKTIHEISEELMIQTPRYWLAPALVGLAAWSKDDLELAEKSIEEAFSRDPKKTSLFFALVLRRQARLAEATRWLHHYFVSLDPRGLTREFAVLLEATAQDGFGQDGRRMVAERLDEWSAILREEQSIVEAQIAKWRGEFEAHRGDLDATEYEYLPAVSPEWSAVEAGIEHASAHEFIIDKYTQVRDASVGLSASVADRLDDLLELLVTEFDDEELPLRREALFQQALIDHDGDEQRARQQADVDTAALDERVDALSLQTHTAFRPDLFGVSTATQRVAVGASSEDFSAAVSRYSRDYRAKWPADITVSLDPSHSGYASTYGFTGWSAKASTPQQDAEKTLVDRWTTDMSAHIESQRFSASKVIIPIIIGAVAAIIGLLTAPGGLVVTLGAIAVVALIVLRKRKACAAAVATAESEREKAIQASVDMYRGALAEWVDARLMYEEEDRKETQVLELIEGWPR